MIENQNQPEKYTDEKVAQIVESEGLGYAVQHYLSSNSIENPGLAKAWGEAKVALDKIKSMLPDLDEDE